MMLLRKILHKINGLKFSKEYLCFPCESIRDFLYAYLVSGSKVIKDITKQHAFVGYKPLLFSISGIHPSGEDLPHRIRVVFTNSFFHPNDSMEKKDALATLTMERTARQFTGSLPIALYEGKKGTHRFLSSFHQWALDLENWFANRKPGNVYLPGNNYRQVQIAYSLPRNISLITVGGLNKYNLFPTDLHGQADEQHYIISLRKEGKAAKQVQESGNIVLTQVSSGFFKTAYALGKNHMKELQEKAALPFDSQNSSFLKLPLPPEAILYRELELLESTDHGIHRLFLFRVLCMQRLRDAGDTLCHIHNVYASWRVNHGLAGNYLTP